MDTKRFYFRFSNRDTAMDKLGFERCWQMALKWGCKEEFIYWDFDSGANTQREKYRQLIREIEAGLVTQIGTPNQIRLNRDSVESQIFGRLLRKKNVTLHLLESKGTLDLQSTESRRQYGLDGLFAEWEYEKIQDRNLRNWQDIRNKRFSILTPFGWVTDSDRKPIPDYTPTVCLIETKQEISYAEILLEIIDLVLEQGSLRRVVRKIHEKYGVYRFNSENLIDGKKQRQKKLNPHKDNPHIQRKPLFLSTSGVKHLLRNPILIGTLVYLKKTDREFHQPNNHPPLISIEKFDRLDKVLSGKLNPYSVETSKAFYPLSGVVYCGHCGGSCYSSTAGKRKNGTRPRPYHYYRCKNIAHNCIAKPIRFELAEQVVINALLEKYQAVTDMAVKPEVHIKNSKLIELKQNLAALKSLPFIDHNIKKSINQIECQIQLIQSQGEHEVIHYKGKKELLEQAFQNPLYWETLSNCDKREIYQQLVKRVVVKVDIQEKSHPEFKNRKSYIDRVDLGL